MGRHHSHHQKGRTFVWWDGQTDDALVGCPVSTVVLVLLLLAAPLTVAAQPPRPASPQKTGEITGLVDFCGGLPSGVSVHIPGESFQARVAATGRFVLRFVPVGTYSLVVEAPGRQPYHVLVVGVADNQITDLGSVSICRDNDGDGFDETVDCNDNNPAVHPNAAELCDGVDNNCNGTVDEGCALCTDADGDGFYAQAGCGTALDCNDSDPLISPAAPETCDRVDNNCNGLVDETFDLTSDASNCGVCGQVCSFANGVAGCAAGACFMTACAPGFADCDGDLANGCESSTASSGSCGACGVVCALPNASATCSSGTCGIESCDTGFANCDSIAANGCERVLSGASNTPSTAEYLGSFVADSADGFLCSPSPCALRLSRTGTGGRYFEVVARESSTCLTSSPRMRVVLTVPSGMSYALRASGSGFSCVTSTGLASCEDAGTGTLGINLIASNRAGEDDTFTAGIEVRPLGGSSCQLWTLYVSSGGC
jgi:hypothetical protein